MISKNSTPIGYLIELLGVSVKDMAKCVFVDATTISKWKTGKRPFDSKCDHFEDVVAYFYRKDNEKKQNLLESLFNNIYGPTEYKKKDYIENSISKFLDHKVVPTAAQSTLAQANGLLYTSTTNVYSSVEGRKVAMDIILDEAERAGESAQLTLFDRELFNWFVFDDQYLKKWCSKIISILKNGGRVTIIVNTAVSPDVFGLFIFKKQIFHEYSNYSEYYFVSTVNIRLLPSTYNLRNRLTILGYNDDKTIYSCMFKDSVSIEQGYHYLSELMKECHPTVIPKTVAERSKVFELIAKYEELDEPSYVVSHSLTFASMSEQLFRQVLRDNGIVGELKNAILNNYAATRASRSRSTDIPTNKHIVSFNMVEECLKHEKIYCQDLSAYLGKEIYMTNEQYREHIRNAAQSVLENPNYIVALTTKTLSLPSQDSVYRVKQKLYCCYSSSMISFNSENSIVNVSYSIIDNFWNNKLTAENKDRNYIAGQLLGLLD